MPSVTLELRTIHEASFLAFVSLAVSAVKRLISITELTVTIPRQAAAMLRAIQQQCWSRLGLCGVLAALDNYVRNSRHVLVFKKC